MAGAGLNAVGIFDRQTLDFMSRRIKKKKKKQSQTALALGAKGGAKDAEPTSANDLALDSTSTGQERSNSHEVKQLGEEILMDDQDSDNNPSGADSARVSASDAQQEGGGSEIELSYELEKELDSASDKQSAVE
ncbi:hypothetical protein BVY02_01890 [bacterium J17]|nr:hypothetical protein BVY02_01890 [bacterium J17]